MSNVFTGLKVEDVYGQLAYPLKYLVTIYDDEVYILDLKNINATTNTNDKPIDANSVEVSLVFTTCVDKKIRENNNWHYHFMRNTLYQILRNNYPKIIDERSDYVVNNTGMKSEDLLKIINIYRIKLISTFSAIDFAHDKITIDNLNDGTDSYIFANIAYDNNNKNILYEISKDRMEKILYCIRKIRNAELKE